MAENNQDLGLEQRIKSEAALYQGMYNRGDRKLFGWAIGVAVVLHAVILFIHFPEIKRAPREDKKENVVVMRKYVPPPPKIERRVVEKKEIKKKAPIPDPTPDEPEPIREPEPEIEDDPIPPDFDIIIGDPTPPPAPSGPLIPGVGGVTNPVKIEESSVKPDYPELARRARVEARVILQAVIRKDGTVGELEVLQCNRPNMGFEDEAKKAVQQWRYEPALQGDRPVEVFLTVFVEFSLS